MKLSFIFNRIGYWTHRQEIDRTAKTEGSVATTDYYPNPLDEMCGSKLVWIYFDFDWTFWISLNMNYFTIVNLGCFHIWLLRYNFLVLFSRLSWKITFWWIDHKIKINWIRNLVPAEYAVIILSWFRGKLFRIWNGRKFSRHPYSCSSKLGIWISVRLFNR